MEDKENKNFENDSSLENLAASVAGSDGEDPENSVPPSSESSNNDPNSDSKPGGEIDDLLKKYEDLPKEPPAPGKPPKEKKKKVGKKIPVVPAAVLGAVILAVILFLLFKPKKETAVVVRHPVPSVKKMAVKPRPQFPKFVLPGAANIVAKKEDGVALNIFDTTKSLRDIKIFYQKKMAEAGFEILKAQTSDKMFGMTFANGARTYGISVIPAKGKNIVVLSHSE